MMKSCSVILMFIFAAVSLMFVGNVQAQSAKERAGELGLWREHCNDPDPDMQLAYIESAIQSGDVSIQRICTRLALESDNSDIKNFGLRAAIASSKQITFSVEMPQALKREVERAGKDKNALKKLYESKLYMAYALLANGLPVIIDEANMSSSTSIWYPLINEGEKKDFYKGNAVIEGKKIIWVGKLHMISGVSDDGSINVTIEPGGKLNGFYKPSNLPSFPISAKLW